MTDTSRAMLWMIGAIASFSAMAVAGRAASLELDTFEILLYRSVVGVGIVLAVAGASNRLRDIRANRLGLHALRNLAHFTGQNLWFFAVTAIPLAQVFALEFTTPIWVILFAPFLLGERITRIGLLSALIGFVGVLLVARPTTAGLDPGLLAAAGCAIGFALSAIFTRRLTRTESIVSILFWLTLMQAVFGLICAGVDGDITLPSATSLPWVILIAFAGLLAHFSLTTALSLAPAAIVMPIDFARLPVIAVIGAMFYDEPLNLLVFVGAGLIFFGNYLNITRGQSARPIVTRM